MGVEEYLTALLDESSGSVVSSVRLPRGLHEALRVAVDLGWVSSINDGQVQALRGYLEVHAQQAALEEHFAMYPQARPSLAEVAVALAELEHNPLADNPDLIERAAAEVLEAYPDGDADDVLLVAETLMRHGIGVA